MIICDNCKDITRKAFDCAIKIEKHDNEKPKLGKKSNGRTIITVPLHLCEQCITKQCKDVGRFVNWLQKRTIQAE